jgi:uncharacterized membrane protein YjgN (DUF898 family)
METEIGKKLRFGPMRIRAASGFMTLAIIVGYLSFRAFNDGSTVAAVIALVFAALLFLVGCSILERYVMMTETELVMRGLLFGVVRVAKDVEFKDIQKIQVRRGATLLRLEGVVVIWIHANDGRPRLLIAVSRTVILKPGDKNTLLFDNLVKDLNALIEPGPS